MRYARLITRYYIHVSLGVSLLFLLCLYRFTAAPTIGWVDSGLIAAAANTLGIPNPPGFPTYLVIAHLFSKLPGSLISDLQLLSQLSALGTLLIVYAFTQIYVTHKWKHWIGIATILVLGTSYTFWIQANHIETYQVTNFFLMCILYGAYQLYVRIHKNYTQYVWLGIWGLVILAGISSGTNPIIASVVPAGIWFVFKTRLFWKRHTKFFWILTALLMSTIALVYLYLPLRAMAHPFLNWGDPQTIARFFHHLRGAGLNIYDPRTNSVNGFTGQPLIFAKSMGTYIHQLILQFTPFLLPLIIFGAHAWRTNNERYAILRPLIGLTLCTNLLFVILYYGGNQEIWMMTSWILISLFLASGIETCLIWIERQHPSSFRSLLIFFFSLSLTGPLLFWFPITNHREHAFARAYARDMYRQVPENSVIIGGGDFFNSLTAFEKEGARTHPTIIPITYNMFYIFPWYRENMRRTTDLVISPALERKTTPVSIQGVSEVIEQLIIDNPGKTFFVTPLVLRDSIIAGTTEGVYVPTSFALVPHGLLFKVVPKPEQPKINLALYEFDIFPLLHHHPVYLERTARGAYRTLRSDYAFAFQELGVRAEGSDDLQRARQFLEQSVAVSDPSDPHYIHRLAIFDASHADPIQAREEFLEALARAPEDSVIASNLKILEEEQRKQASGSAIPAPRYVSAFGVTFTHPQGWDVSETGSAITLKGPPPFTIEIRKPHTLSGSFEDFLDNQPTSGDIINQGVAKIPGTTQAWVRIEIEGEIKRMHFFLVYGTKVLDVRVWPPDSIHMRDFDALISSLKIAAP